ncbi:hypothetical protein A2Z22_00865 [Candidatus Woesebacteria bacterium RBG_16_34_12]|uniref:N-acetyltransferase domain-containing protein n=1 Tax=Candidatus Woesebacteria bacterium RBG_16_34_12 TaxID=1802480 RepID=A0A1F7X8R3_9BACT|nr:MAG: hypothetical protein A2Z22_00865 [Candidatus Woesebacteria bacterium RBG_16_34_12]
MKLRESTAKEKAEEIDPVTILLTHMRLECIGVTPNGLMERISGQYPDEIANLYIIKHSSGFTVFMSKNVPLDIRERLKALPVEMAFVEPETVKIILGKLYPKEGPRRGKSYIFPSNLDPKIFPDAVLLSSAHEQLFREFEPDSHFPKHPAFGIITDNKLVCVCESSKENDEAAESWVRTLEAYRGKGYAKQATLAWAYNLQQSRKIPFYSHKESNLQSQAVAISLGLIQYSEEVSY